MPDMDRIPPLEQGCAAPAAAWGWGGAEAAPERSCCSQGLLEVLPAMGRPSKFKVGFVCLPSRQTPNVS